MLVLLSLASTDVRLGECGSADPCFSACSLPTAVITLQLCLIVREAGGFVSDFRGRSQPIHSAQVLAGNDALHSKLHKLLVGALKA